MRRRVIAAIVRKDVTTVWRNRGARLPMILVPLILLVVLPALTVGGLVAAGGSPGEVEPWARHVLQRLFIPAYLIVPVLVAMVVATDSIAGERERGTLESLLHSPATSDELLLGKVLAAWLPAVVVGLAAFLAFTITGNVVAWPATGELILPTAVWAALALWFMPALAALSLALMVHVSFRVRSVQAANQIGALGIVPAVLVIVVPLGARFETTGLVLISGAVAWGLFALAVFAGRGAVQRDELAVRL